VAGIQKPVASTQIHRQEYVQQRGRHPGHRLIGDNDSPYMPHSRAAAKNLKFHAELINRSGRYCRRSFRVAAAQVAQCFLWLQL